ncbi:hypothetical protein NRY95_00290 [Xanthomonas campestris pv. phormiicola]|uniref:hypothetical protein n=1 Tax=Xanthomonas sp. JAI131 TaxID=2723067 RepID=UPI0015C9DCC3|nr:hypothetical protein [Xanthomonas sp. JAI131]MCC4598364.1 hypothetical protein [Xanthomonas campestris pv. phormiicola]NYF22317.1 hypothetical protein [Xanthomonas sp. JAI131]UYC16464.1 hypothetical protein NRY95_00290 [Xanthomonas campestris pv. phormiicola]
MKLRPLDKRQEKHLLASMLASMNEPIDNRWQSMFKREVIGLTIPFLVVVIALGVLRANSLLTLFTTTGALVVGLAIGFGQWRMSAARHWPAVARCLDRNKIEQRLRELDG